MLRVHPLKNGGAQVQGWDKDTYSITACKAALGSDARQLLSQIKLSVKDGEVSVSWAIVGGQRLDGIPADPHAESRGCRGNHAQRPRQLLRRRWKAQRASEQRPNLRSGLLWRSGHLGGKRTDQLRRQRRETAAAYAKWPDQRVCRWIQLDRRRIGSRRGKWTVDLACSVGISVGVPGRVQRPRAAQLPRQHLLGDAPHLGRRSSPHRIRIGLTADPAFDAQRTDLGSIVATPSTRRTTHKFQVDLISHGGGA